MNLDEVHLRKSYEKYQGLLKIETGLYVFYQIILLHKTFVTIFVTFFSEIMHTTINIGKYKIAI